VRRLAKLASCALALGLSGCPGEAPAPAAPSVAPTATAESSPAATKLTKAALIGTWTDAAKPGFTFEFTQESFVLESGGTKMPLAYEVAESSRDTITIVTHEELLGTDETRDTRITYRVVDGKTLERLARDGVGAGTLKRLVEELVAVDYDLSKAVEYSVSGPGPRIKVGDEAEDAGGAGGFRFDEDLDAEGTLRSKLPPLARDCEFTLSKEGVLTLTGSERAHDAVRTWLEKLRQKGELITLPYPSD
jgi:hypothetical protein